VFFRRYGHNSHRENGAYSLGEIKQFLALFANAYIALTIGLTAWRCGNLNFSHFYRKTSMVTMPAFIPIPGLATTNACRDTAIARLPVDGWEPITSTSLRPGG
jgi:hypothetical protein